MIEIAKSVHWESFLQTADDRSIWTAHQYALGDPTDGGRARVPTLVIGRRAGEAAEEASSNEDKTRAFLRVFFPATVQDEQTEASSEYPTPKFSFSPVTDSQIRRAITQLSLYKAPGPDGISNSVFIHCADLLVPHLGPIYRAMFNIRLYPQH